MFLTNVLFKKAKSKMIMVLMESVVSGHQCIKIRERLADKLEFIRFDPYILVSERAEGLMPLLSLFTFLKSFLTGSSLIAIPKDMDTSMEYMNFQQESLYKERKKIRSIKSS